MNKLFAFGAVAFALVAHVSTAHADAASDLEANAQKAYDARDYSQAGRASAQQSSDLFGQLVGQTTDPLKKAEYRVRQAGACFFLGDSTNDNDVKITQFTNGLALAELAVKAFGVNDVTAVSDQQVQDLIKRPKDQLQVLAEGLYVRGINLGQLGVAKGVLSSLDKWPELRADMELIVRIGAKQLHEYGPYRTLGRAYSKIPALLGGDQAKAEKYLKATIDGTKAAGHTYSVNGYNNLFYAELLKDLGRDAEGKALLQDYLTADPNTVLPGYSAESHEAQRLAKDMLANW